MQVEDPSILTKPGPYSAQGFAAVFAGRCGTDVAGLSGLRSRDCCADTDDADNTASPMARTLFRITDVIADGVLVLPDELDAKRFAVAPNRRRAGSAEVKAVPGDRLPGRTNATIRSRACHRTGSHGSASGTRSSRHQRVDLAALLVVLNVRNGGLSRPDRSCRNRHFRSLRLSVRTPPFHGGESGSIPLGSATIVDGYPAGTARICCRKSSI
jgi:hypothetical protein